MSGLVDALQEMGLSLNEAKAYQALLREGPANGYEVSKRSGITRSIVYGVLDRLLEKGYVLQVESDPVIYAPLPPSQLVKRYRESCESNLENLEKNLARMAAGVREDAYILGIAGYDDTIRKARELVREAQHEVVVSAWGSDCVPLREELQEADRAGKKVVIFCHTKVPFSAGVIHQYGLEEEIVRHIWPDRRIIVAADCSTVLIGDIRRDENLGIVTANPMIVQMAVEYVILDIMHLSQLRAGIGDLAAKIEDGEDYSRLVREQHMALGVRAEDLPSPVPVYGRGVAGAQ